MEKFKEKLKKINWKESLSMLVGIIGLILFILVLFLKFWVIFEFADTPISEVPSWAIPWLTNG